MTTTIHPTAQISPTATIDPDVYVGPFCIVGDDVQLGRGTRLIASCSVFGPTSLGRDNLVFPYAVLGVMPQDRSYRGEPTRLEVGNENTFREQVTVHRGTAKDRGITRIGSRGLFMVGAHIAHDATIGDDVTLANGTMLGGHVELGDGVATGGLVACAPFVAVGMGAFLAAGSMVERNIPPFALAAGDRATVRTLNRVGLERLGLPDGSIRALGRAFRLLFRTSPRSGLRRGTVRAEVIAELRADPVLDRYVGQLLDFLERPARVRV